MTIEIWSDVACPFCYIGQAHLRKALAEFAEKEHIQIEWKSFILDPSLPNESELNIYESLSQRKGIPMPQVMQMTARVEQMAQQAGLEVNFDIAKPVSTARAHLLIQLAKQYGKGDAMEQRLFEAYFREGASMADASTLMALGAEVGLDAAEVKRALDSTELQARVQADIAEARNLGISGVPYFRLNGKYGISGAQPAPALREAIGKAYAEWNKQEGAKAQLSSEQGPGCDVEQQKCD